MGSLREELDQCRRNNGGRLTPRTVVEQARRKDHPLHERFEWDDRLAGDRYRIQQASELIRSVRIRYSEGKEGPKDVRAFVSIPDPNSPTREYKPLDEVVQDPIAVELLLREAKRDAMAYRRKYSHLKEYIELVQQMLDEQTG